MPLSLPGSPPSPVRRWQRLLAALVATALAAALARHSAQVSTNHVSDLFLPWRSAVALRAGLNPWDVIGTGRAVDPGGGLLYPATAAVTLLPFSGLSIDVTSIAWAAVGMGLLVYAVSAGGLWRLVGLLSWPVMLATTLPQWSPLLTAAACLPLLGGLLIAKPTLGLALAAMRLDARWWRSAVVGGAIIFGISLWLAPTWISDWWTALHEPPRLLGGMDARNYFQPVATPLGFLLLAVLARWRRPEARLLAGLACVPHVPMGYEYVAVLLLVPATLAEACALALLSWVHAIAYWSWALQPSIFDTFARALPLSIGLILAPAVVLVLRRPNEGETPAWLERLVARTIASFRPRAAPAEPGDA